MTSIVAVVSATPDRRDATSAHDRCSANAGAAPISVTTRAAVVRANGLKAMVMICLSARLSREMLADKLATVAIKKGVSRLCFDLSVDQQLIAKRRVRRGVRRAERQ